MVRERGFKVVLTGEGADEVFAGYDIFKEAKIRHFCESQPDSAARPQLLRKLYPYLPMVKGQSQKYLEAFFGTGQNDIADPLSSHLLRYRTTSGAKDFFFGDYDALDDMRASLPADFGSWHFLNQAQYLETRYLLPGYILSSQGDRVSMAHAVEGRFPFLDHRVVEFAAKLPPRMKMQGLREKHILREAVKDLLPKGIVRRTKQPYRAPDAASFAGHDAPGWISQAMSHAAVSEAGYFDPLAVSRLHARCRDGKVAGFRQNMAVVGVLSTQVWHEQFVAKGRTVHTPRLAASSR
jgi:asparagine synthase (glutamine-hydrolysing)